MDLNRIIAVPTITRAATSATSRNIRIGISKIPYFQKRNHHISRSTSTALTRTHIHNVATTTTSTTTVKSNNFTAIATTSAYRNNYEVAKCYHIINTSSSTPPPFPIGRLLFPTLLQQLNAIVVRLSTKTTTTKFDCNTAAIITPAFTSLVNDITTSNNDIDSTGNDDGIRATTTTIAGSITGKDIYSSCGNKRDEKSERRRNQLYNHRHHQQQQHHQLFLPYICQKRHQQLRKRSTILSSSSFVGEVRRTYISDRNGNKNSNSNNNKNMEKKDETSITTAIGGGGTSDPSMVSWVDDYLPSSLRPYGHLSRMDKPIGTWLLLWPCYWSTAMAAGVVSTSSPPIIDTATVAVATMNLQKLTLFDVLPDPKLLGLFTIGAFVMRGAGCTINDLWDSDLDRQVERTKTRPLASGEITQKQAISWLAIQLSLGFLVLVSLPHTQYCFLWGVASLPIVVIYPLMKRMFDYPQLVLGLCFNWGAIMGWAAVHGSIDYSVIVPLYLSGVSWTIGYDTLYAHQDKKDDAKLGLKSTAITFGRNSSSSNNNIGNGDGDGDGNDLFDIDDDRKHKRILHKLAIATYACWLLAGYNGIVATSTTATMMSSSSSLSLLSSSSPILLSLSPALGIYAMGITGAYSHLYWQIQTADLNNPHNLAERFRSNAKVGGIVFGSILASKIALVSSIGI